MDKAPKTKEEIIDILAQHQEDLERLQVKSLALFGSVARGEQRPDSDIDFLVEFNAPMGLMGFLRIRNYLSDILEAKVDLVTPDAVKPQYKKGIIQECIHAIEFVV